MATPNRGSIRARVNNTFVLAAVDDLNGVQDATKDLDVSGSERVIILQVSEAADNAAGLDVIEISKDGGVTWFADPTLLPGSEDDITGTVATNGGLNVAGTEPALGAVAMFKSGPHTGPTKMRCKRDGADSAAASIAWTTGAPGVHAIIVGAEKA